MLLVDSSVWIDHLRVADPALVRYLGEENVLCHAFVVGEVAMGSIRDRERTVARLNRLPIANEARHSEVMLLVEQERLFSRGLSWIDAHLLASTLITPGARLWTRDRRLHDAADQLAIAARPTG